MTSNSYQLPPLPTLMMSTLLARMPDRLCLPGLADTCATDDTALGDLVPLPRSLLFIHFGVLGRLPVLTRGFAGSGAWR
jgi:hypothetical protein